jgi:hypothetical protein
MLMVGWTVKIGHYFDVRKFILLKISIVLVTSQLKIIKMSDNAR